jgi:hypothetical protein
MSLRAVLTSRSLFNVSRSSQIVRSLTSRPRLSLGIVARNGIFQTRQIRGFQSSAIRAFPPPQEGFYTNGFYLLILRRLY